MSTLKVGTIQSTSGGSSSTPEQIEQGRAKCWINFNGEGTISIVGSFGISSISDRGTGAYTITYTTAFANDNYCIAAMSRANGSCFGPLDQADLNVSNCTLDHFDGGGNRRDREVLGAAFFGDV